MAKVRWQEGQTWGFSLVWVSCGEVVERIVSQEEGGERGEGKRTMWILSAEGRAKLFFSFPGQSSQIYFLCAKSRGGSPIFLLFLLGFFDLPPCSAGAKS